MIGQRIKQARKAAGLSLHGLGEKVGMSAMMVSKYEKNQSTPSSTALLALAEALGVRTEYFFRQMSVELENINHREHHLLPDSEERKVLADIKEQLERWLALEDVLTPLSMSFALSQDFPKRIASWDDIEELAILVRQDWNLGLNPIPDLIDTLETRGIKVLITQYDGHKNFNGLSATLNESPVIVVGQNWSGDRQRFTIAHELGHLVLRDLLSGGLDEEKACNRFAGAFLVPKPMVLECLGQRRKWLEPQELHLLKHEWGLSMQAWAVRAKELNVISQTVSRKLQQEYLGEWKLRKEEPGEQYRPEETRLFGQLVYRALAEELLSESKAAELLNISVMEFHECRTLQAQGGEQHGTAGL